jgi:hypothetical protein
VFPNVSAAAKLLLNSAFELEGFWTNHHAAIGDSGPISINQILIIISTL